MDGQDFDFDEWMALARTDAKAFEAKRKAAIEDVIASAPEHLRQRLRGLQWRIDRERERCGTPLSACLRLYTMMWDAVHAERGFLWALRALSDSPPRTPATAAVPSARILAFKPGKSG